MSDLEQKINSYGGKNLAAKKRWYGGVAEAYYRTRPRYSQQLIDCAISKAKLTPTSHVLEIGCGPGTATVALAQRRFKLTSIEPNREACELARQNCIAYDNVEFINTTFEEWQSEQKFDAVVAATSFHWISSEVRYSKTASCLRDSRHIILFWNTPPQLNYQIYQQILEPVYQTYRLDFNPYEHIATHQKNIGELGQSLIDSGLFENLVSEQFIFNTSYTIDDYITLLSTLSPYIALSEEKRLSLLQDLKKVLVQQYQDQLNLSYLSMVQVATKK